MITNENYQELLTRSLELDEKIIFDFIDKKVHCNVRSSYLGCDNGPEILVLRELQQRGLLDKSNKEYCTELYGYKCKDIPEDSTAWPDCRDRDFKALTRIVIDIFDRISSMYNVKKIDLAEVGSISFLK